MSKVTPSPAGDVDYRQFLARLDMTWEKLVHRGGRYYDNPVGTRRDWGEAALLGNGMLGAAIYKKTATGLTWELGRNDVEAHNKLPGFDWCVPRVPIGDLVLTSPTPVQQESMRLCLYDAELRGRMTTESGVVEWVSFADAQRDVLVLVLEGVAADVMLQPAHGISPCLHWKSKAAPETVAAAAPLPPLPKSEQIDDVELTVQAYVDASGQISGESAVALKRLKLGPNHTAWLLSIENSRTNGDAQRQSVAAVNQAAAMGIDALRSEHRNWWHAYWRRSFLSLPDTRWECFYWIQLYKLGSATRADKAEVIDNQGPWLTDTAWPGTWWNLNVQLSYTSMYKANRLDLATSLLNTLDANRVQIARNAAPISPDGMYMGRCSGRHCEGNVLPTREQVMSGKLSVFELGNFAWISKLLYTHYRSCMDDKLLIDKIYPIMRATLNVGLQLLHRWDDGCLHLPKTTSPEYPDPKSGQGSSYPAHDTSYDLALLRWLLQTLLRTNTEHNLEDELEPVWRRTLDDLAPLPIDDNGIMVARDLPFELSHRHYSHLFAFYPLHLLDLDDPGQRALAEKSFLHWINTTGALEGYSYTGGACMAAALGDGNLALRCLNGLRDYLLPNTMYVEGGGPVIETPLSGAESIHYMLLQCHGDTLRVFPAVPEAWHDLSFAHLLAEGAFLVSGKRENGMNLWVLITSQAGQPLRVMPNLPGPVKYHSDQPVQVEAAANGLYTIKLQAGASVLLYNGETVPEAKATPVVSQRQFENFYGSEPVPSGAKQTIVNPAFKTSQAERTLTIELPAEATDAIDTVLCIETDECETSGNRK